MEETVNADISDPYASPTPEPAPVAAPLPAPQVATESQRIEQAPAAGYPTPAPVAPAPAPLSQPGPTQAHPAPLPQQAPQADPEESAAPPPLPMPAPEPEPEPRPAPVEAAEPAPSPPQAEPQVVGPPQDVRIANDHPANRPRIERLLAGLVRADGSDMHLSAGEVPRYRVHGALLPVAGEPPIRSEEIESLIEESVSARAWSEFKEHGDLDTSYSMSTEQGSVLDCRFRVNVFRSMDTTGTVMRVIPTKIKTLDEIGAPPQLARIAEWPRGIAILTGPTGSGKSTTLAALVDLINQSRSERIFTLEDPIEFVHSSKKCMVSHREIGEDTPSFEEGLRRVRREDPDIILVGEMRDYQTIAAAIEAADTGHLVLTTLHANSAAETISRIINQFPAGQQEQIKTTLAATLKAVVTQTLVPSSKSPMGRALAAEVLFVNSGVANNIRENDIPAINAALIDRSAGNQSMDAALADLIRSGLITKREALKKCTKPENLEAQLGGSSDQRRI